MSQNLSVISSRKYGKQNQQRLSFSQNHYQINLMPDKSKTASTKWFSQRPFSLTGPAQWNSELYQVCHSKSASAFKCSQNPSLQVCTFLICFRLLAHRDSWICSHHGHACVMCVCVYSHDYYVLEFNTALCPQSLYRLFGMGSPGQPPRLSHSSWTLKNLFCPLLLTFMLSLEHPPPPPPPPPNNPPFSLFDYLLLVFTICIAIVKHIAFLIQS